MEGNISRHYQASAEGQINKPKNLFIVSPKPQIAMEDEIKAEFKKSGFSFDNEEEILQKCLTLCIEFQLSPPDLVSSWDVFSLNRGLELTVQSAHMDAFVQQLQNDQRDAVVKKEPGLHFYSNDVAMLLNDEYEDTKEDILQSPPPTLRLETPNRENPDSAQRSNRSIYGSKRVLDTVTPFGQRKTKFVVQFTLNEPSSSATPMRIDEELGQENSEDDIIKRVQASKRCSIDITSSQPKPGCRFMYDRIEDKFNLLENRIKKYADSLVDSGLYDRPVDPSVASQKSLLAVGMICCEEDGRLKEKPVLLQSSVEHSGGQRIRLDLQKLEQFSIFPGQVVGVEGHNPSGHCLIASKIIDQVPFSNSSSEDLQPVKKLALDPNVFPDDPSDSVPELSMIIAAGPYTTSDNLLFEPLTELLGYARRKQPQLLVLLGPFIDSDHPKIKKGTVDRTFDDMFHLEVLGRLQDYVEYMGSSANVILVPSIRDAHHDFVFPQPSFDISADLKHQIHCISNPGTFKANEVKVASLTVDILKHLTPVEISRNPPGGSKQRLTALSNHILNQRSFYPLYPPAEGVPLDFSLAPEALQIASVPDILILPSDLAQFVRVLSLKPNSEEEKEIKCLCINPGRLAKGEGGGFFVEVNYHGSPDSATASVIRI